MVSEDFAASPTIWCYLAEVGSYLIALPDDDRTVLLPYLSAVPQVSALPAALMPAYVLGLVNVAQRAEMLIDLAALLALRDAPLTQSRLERRRMVVYGEGISSVREPYRLAFALDSGYEFAAGTLPPEPSSHPLGALARHSLATPRGIAALLDMEMVCNKVLHDLAATRLWNEPDAPSEEVEGDL